MDGRGHNPLWGQVVEEPAHRHHVGDGVQGAHLVEVDFLHRAAVGVALRLGDELVHRFGVLAHRLGDVQMGENVADVPHARVVVMAVAVPVGVLVGVLMAVLVGMAVLVAGMGLVLGRLVDMFVAVGVEGHVVALLLFPGHGDGDLGAGDAALDSGLGGKDHTGQAQAVHALGKALGVGVKL